jgi:hypothetical protein
LQDAVIISGVAQPHILAVLSQDKWRNPAIIETIDYLRSFLETVFEKHLETSACYAGSSTPGRVVAG